jgi:hypothetical protein
VCRLARGDEEVALKSTTPTSHRPFLLIAQLIRDFEDPKEVNTQLEQM